MQDGVPVASHPPVRQPDDATADLPVQVLPLRRLHCDVAGEGVQQPYVFVRRVAALPDISPHLNVTEKAAGLDLRRLVWDLFG